MTPARVAAARRRYKEGESARQYGRAVLGVGLFVVFWLVIFAGYWLNLQ